jgi:hypothetical protein
MATQKNNQIEKFKAAEEIFYRAWQDVENAVFKLQEATERARQSLSKITPELARDPKSWQVLDPLLHLEELTLDAGRVVDDVKRKIDAPPRYETQGKKG